MPCPAAAVEGGRGGGGGGLGIPAGGMAGGVGGSGNCGAERWCAVLSVTDDDIEVISSPPLPFRKPAADNCCSSFFLRSCMSIDTGTSSGLLDEEATI